MISPAVPSPPGVACIRLAAVLTAVSVSREFAGQTLRAWQLHEHIDAAELVASELVTNAVKSTGLIDPDPKWSDIKGHHIIGVQVRAIGASLFVEVWDRGNGSPVIPEQEPEAEGGRGLFLVEALSERWGIYRPAAGGKIVWAELSLMHPVDVSKLTEQLPRRVPGAVGPKPDADLVMVDTALMQRVLDGLRQMPTLRRVG